MPRGDGTGPRGQGAGTGRGKGKGGVAAVARVEVAGGVVLEQDLAVTACVLTVVKEQPIKQGPPAMISNALSAERL